MAAKRRNMGPSQELRAFADEVIALEIDKKDIADTIKELYEAKAAKGYDVGALRTAVKRRMESAVQRATRREREAIADVYSAAMGDLFGKPLDDLARARMEEERQRMAGEPTAAQEQAESGQAEAPLVDGEPTAPEKTADEAREEGRQARRDGKRIVDNPYHSSSPLRAAWDEGWCEADGSDGMEIPAAWKRKPQEDDKANEKKPEGGDGQNAGGAGEPNGGGGTGGAPDGGPPPPPAGEGDGQQPPAEQG